MRKRKLAGLVKIDMRSAHGLCLVVIVMLGCASAPPREMAYELTRETLLAGEALGASDTDLVPVGTAEVLAVDTDMHAFLDRYVDRRASRAMRLQQLVYAIIHDGTFGLEYGEKTHTAAETFRTRHGNCLSFTNMFVAMAREVDLDVHYQEVDIPPDWSFSNDTFVLSRHVNAHIDLKEDGEQVVDFNMVDFRTSYDRRQVSDRRAMAHYHNNMGVERMQAGDSAAAVLHFRAALVDNDHRFSPAWTNLGTLYLRAGHSAHAEAAYLQALEVDRRDYVAMSNLARLYDRQGDTERAAYYRDRARYHRMRNPYYRHQLAREAFLAQEYETAIDHLKYAIRRKPEEDTFHFLMGLSHLQLGDEKAARSSLERAEALAAAEGLKRNYRSKMDLLLSASEE